MSNVAEWGDYSALTEPDIGWVTVNGTHDQNGLPLTGKDRLNAIFGDINRDLAFIIPIADVSGNYVVGCPLVRRNSGFTYFCGDSSTDPNCGCSCGSLTDGLDDTTHNGNTCTRTCTWSTRAV